MKSQKNDSGSILMEFVLVAPILYLLIFGVVQFAYIFLAKQMAFYAAYSAARAALVYNVKDYSNYTSSYSRNNADEVNAEENFQFFSDKGPLYVTACTIMSWLNSGSSNSMEYFPGADSDVWNRVLISGKEFHDSAHGVLVTVHYFCPMFVPLVGDLLAAGLGPDDKTKAGDAWSVVGWLPQFLPDYQEGISVNSALKVAKAGGFLSIHLQETCYLAKPYATHTFARIPAEDKSFFLLNEQENAGGAL